MRTEYVGRIGYFDETLFIDGVDFDYCIRIRKNKFKIAQVNSALLMHHLGDMREKSLFGWTVYPTYHNHIRRYYIVRNKLRLGAKYLFFDSSFAVKSIVRLCYDFLLICVFEPDKLKKIYYGAMGLRDFIIGRSGKIKP